MPHLTINYTQDVNTVYDFVTDPENIKKRCEASGERNVRIEVEEDAQLPAVLTAVDQGGATLLRVIPLRSSLEDVFLKEVGWSEPPEVVIPEPSTSPRYPVSTEIFGDQRETSDREQEVH